MHRPQAGDGASRLPEGLSGAAPSRPPSSPQVRVGVAPEGFRLLSSLVVGPLLLPAVTRAGSAIRAGDDERLRRIDRDSIRAKWPPSAERPPGLGSLATERLSKLSIRPALVEPISGQAPEGVPFEELSRPSLSPSLPPKGVQTLRASEIRRPGGLDPMREAATESLKGESPEPLYGTAIPKQTGILPEGKEQQKLAHQPLLAPSLAPTYRGPAGVERIGTRAATDTPWQAVGGPIAGKPAGYRGPAGEVRLPQRKPADAAAVGDSGAPTSRNSSIRPILPSLRRRGPPQRASLPGVPLPVSTPGARPVGKTLAQARAEARRGAPPRFTLPQPGTGSERLPVHDLPARGVEGEEAPFQCSKPPKGIPGCKVPLHRHSRFEGVYFINSGPDPTDKCRNDRELPAYGGQWVPEGLQSGDCFYTNLMTGEGELAFDPPANAFQYGLHRPSPSRWPKCGNAKSYPNRYKYVDIDGLSIQSVGGGRAKFVEVVCDRSAFMARFPAWCNWANGSSVGPSSEPRMPFALCAVVQGGDLAIGPLPLEDLDPTKRLGGPVPRRGRKDDKPWMRERLTRKSDAELERIQKTIDKDQQTYLGTLFRSIMRRNQARNAKNGQPDKLLPLPQVGLPPRSNDYVETDYAVHPKYIFNLAFQLGKCHWSFDISKPGTPRFQGQTVEELRAGKYWVVNEGVEVYWREQRQVSLLLSYDAEDLGVKAHVLVDGWWMPWGGEFEPVAKFKSEYGWLPGTGEDQSENVSVIVRSPEFLRWRRGEIKARLKKHKEGQVHDCPE